MKERDNFKTRFGALVALVGSAVGLGNLWRFPYMVGKNGGAAFIIIYILVVFILCLPIMISEMVIGRRGKANAYRSFENIAPHTAWKYVGLFGAIASICILSFYCVVGGWSVDYLLKAITFQFTSNAAGAGSFTDVFNAFASAPVKPLIFTFIYLALTGLVVMLGVSGGIEKFSKWVMPLLFVMIIVMAIWSLFLPGGKAGFAYMFKPDFSLITWKTVLAALGQSFFSLSLGSAIIITYGSYIKEDDDISKLCMQTAVGDTLFAILAGCAIMPAVFAFGVSPAQGPGLVFSVLPNIFAHMPFGGVLAIVFFLILFIAAITSSISLMEVPTAYFIEEKHMKRPVATIVVGAIIMFFSIFCSLSQGPLASFKLLGMNIFDFFDYVTSNFLLPLGGLLLVIFIGYRMGKAAFCDEMTSGGTIKKKKWMLDWFYFCIKYLCPVAIILVFITNLFIR
jgi:NSS family neurotransmitter:Na+ symporter